MGARFEMNPNFGKELRREPEAKWNDLLRSLGGKDVDQVRAGLEAAGFHDIDSDSVERISRGETVNLNIRL
jgi:hypothetical protein